MSFSHFTANPMVLVPVLTPQHVAIQVDLLLCTVVQELMDREWPENTKAAYKSKEAEFKQFCIVAFPFLDPHANRYTVTTDKLHPFLFYQALC